MGETVNPTDEHLKRIGDSFNRALLIACGGVLLASMAFTAWVDWNSERQTPGCQCKAMRVEASGNEVHIEHPWTREDTIKHILELKEKGKKQDADLSGTAR